MRAIAEGGGFCFSATAGPDGAVFFNRNHFGGFARPFVGAVAVGGVLALPAAAESQGLTGFRIDFEGRGLPAHGFIIEQSLENESAKCGEVESAR